MLAAPAIQNFFLVAKTFTLNIDFSVLNPTQHPFWSKKGQSFKHVYLQSLKTDIQLQKKAFLLVNFQCVILDPCRRTNPNPFSCLPTGTVSSYC